MLKTLTPGKRAALIAVVVALGDLVAEYFEAYSGPALLAVRALTAAIGAL